MKANRSIPPAAVIPVLTYPDVPAAARWLASTFGVVEHVRIGDGHRVQMSIGGGASRSQPPAGAHLSPANRHPCR